MRKGKRLLLETDCANVQQLLLSLMTKLIYAHLLVAMQLKQLPGKEGDMDQGKEEDGNR